MGSVRNHTESEMARLNMLMLLLPSLILADGPGGHHHGHHGDHGAHHGAHNENHAHAGGAAHHADHGASHHPVQHTVQSSRSSIILCTAAYRDPSVPVSAFNPRPSTQSSTACHRGPKTLPNSLPLILS